MSKSEMLRRIGRAIENCGICKSGKSGLAVSGEGSGDARVVFIGEAPGKTEAATGRPFVGRSGQLLRKNIAEIGLREEDVFITSVVKYLPDRGTPSKGDIEHGRIHLVEQLDVMKPEILVLLGSVACQGVLEKSVSIREMHGKMVEKNNWRCMIMYHPAAALRFPPLKEEFEKDFLKLKKLLQGLHILRG